MSPASVHPSRSRCVRLARWYRSACLCGILLVALLGKGEPVENPLARVPPRPLREMRGAWIATIANLDWPSKPGLTTEQQKAELIRMLDVAVQLKLNVLIFQVRPACDTFYNSSFEPWSEFLTGKQGKPPEPFYDPLTFAIDEAHRRGLELHAWFNPFRVRLPHPNAGMATNHITRKHPQWIRKHGSQLLLDPGLKAVRDYSTQVILDVVKRYDVDGVHLDDYFYPYPEKNGAGQLLDFPDQPSWRTYTAAGGKLSRPDWRRKNIDDFIEGLYRQIKSEKAWVKFGVSPFGIWKIGFPKELTKGLDAHDHLFADSRRWLMNGWLDYFAPQLYWGIEEDQSYRSLLKWWSSQNAKPRLLTPGNNLTKVGTEWKSSEIVEQIRLTRLQPGTAGNLLYNMSSLLRNQEGLADRWLRNLYAQPALVPACPWLASGPPLAKPKVRLEQIHPKKRIKVSWSNTSNGKDVWLWFYQSRRQGKWTSNIFPGDQTSYLEAGAGLRDSPDLVAVTPIDRVGTAGSTAVLDVTQVLSSAGSTKSVADNR